MNKKRIYFIQGELTGLIKIGQSSDPEARLKSLQIGSPDKLLLLGTLPCWDRSETILHEDFKAIKNHGSGLNPQKNYWLL